MATILADDIIKRIFLNENVWISLKISLKFVRKVYRMSREIWWKKKSPGANIYRKFHVIPWYFVSPHILCSECTQLSWIFKYVAGRHVDHNCAKFKRNPSIGITAIFFQTFHQTRLVSSCSLRLRLHFRFRPPSWICDLTSGRHLEFVTSRDFRPPSWIIGHVTSGSERNFTSYMPSCHHKCRTHDVFT